MNKISKAAIATTFALLAATSTILAQSPSTLGGPVKFEVITPSEGQTIYGDKIPVLFSAENFEIVDYAQNSQPKAGQGHVHIWLDDQNPTAQDATKVTTDTYTFSNVAYGDHTLKAELVTNDHKSMSPPQVVTTKFKNQAIASELADPNQSSFDKRTAMVILVVVALVIVAAWYYTKDEDDEDIDEKPKKKTARKRTKAKRKK